MIRSAVTISLVPEARQGPFVFHGDLQEGCREAAALGYDGVEVFPTHADDLHGLQLREILTGHRLALAAMGTGAGWLRRQLTLTSADPHVRMCARDFASAIVDFAGGFGAPAIIGSMQGRVADGANRSEALDWFARELEQLGPRAHALGVPLLFEPLNRYETNLFNTVDDTLDFLRSLRTQNILLLLDLFHMNIEESGVAAAIRRAGPKLGHVHFADTNRNAIGMGHLEVGPIVQALRDVNYSGWISAEARPRPDSVTAARTTMESFRRWFR